MIFGPTLLPKVLDGTKTMTRRLWPYARVHVGGSYAVQAGRGELAIRGVRLCVTALRRESVGRISPVDVLREGFPTFAAFVAYWCVLYGRWKPGRLVWVVRFERMWTCPFCWSPVAERSMPCGECACEDDCAL